MAVFDELIETLVAYWWISLPSSVVVMLLMYLAVPVLPLLGLRFRSPLRFEPYEAERDTLPNAVVALFSRANSRLAPAGFEEAGIFFSPLVGGNTRAVLMLLVNREALDLAMSVVTYGRIDGVVKGEWQIQTAYTEFSTRFADGWVVGTNNSAQAGSFKKRSTAILTQLRGIQNEQELYRIHRAIVERHGTSKVWRFDTEFAGDAAAYLSDCTEEELDSACETGLMQFGAAQSVYRPTLWGAYNMTWNELSPLKWIRSWQRDREAKRTLQELWQDGVV